MTVAFTLVIAIFLLAMLGTVVQAAGLVDDTVNVANEYSRYPLENYQLDFYVDNSWGWLPWNWSDGIGKQRSEERRVGKECRSRGWRRRNRRKRRSREGKTRWK